VNSLRSSTSNCETVASTGNSVPSARLAASPPGAHTYGRAAAPLVKASSDSSSKRRKPSVRIRSPASRQKNRRRWPWPLRYWQSFSRAQIALPRRDLVVFGSSSLFWFSPVMVTSPPSATRRRVGDQVDAAVLPVIRAAMRVLAVGSHHRAQGSNRGELSMPQNRRLLSLEPKFSQSRSLLTAKVDGARN
jgi:hypothetical protein